MVRTLANVVNDDVTLHQLQKQLISVGFLASEKEEKKTGRDAHDAVNTRVPHAEHQQEIGVSATNWIHLQHVWPAAILSVGTSHQLKRFPLLLRLVLLTGGHQPTFRQELQEHTHLSQHPIIWDG